MNIHHFVNLQLQNLVSIIKTMENFVWFEAILVALWLIGHPLCYIFDLKVFENLQIIHVVSIYVICIIELICCIILCPKIKIPIPDDSQQINVSKLKWERRISNSINQLLFFVSDLWIILFVSHHLMWIIFDSYSNRINNNSNLETLWMHRNQIKAQLAKKWVNKTEKSRQNPSTIVKIEHTKNNRMFCLHEDSTARSSIQKIRRRKTLKFKLIQ